MFSKIIVPLDGSTLAEQALPSAIALARALNAELVLLQAFQVKTIAGQELATEHELQQKVEAYLKHVLVAITSPSLAGYLPAERVTIHAEYGLPEDEIALVAPFEGADLIVMATHSRSGLGQLIKGSVAIRVLQLVSVPVLLVHPTHENEIQPLSKTLSQLSSLEGEGHQLKLVVALDGSLEAEVALEPAVHLAKRLGASLYLVRVVSPAIPAEYVMLRSKQNFIKEEDIARQDRNQREAASQYLQNFQSQLLAEGLNCVKTVLWGDPSLEIVQYAQEIKASMLVMATHVRGRIGQFLLGSVAEEVVSHSHLPVLMVAIGLPDHN